MWKWLNSWWEAYKKEQAHNHFINYEQELTVCCDKSPFWGQGNERERLIRVKGLIKARQTAREWVLKYPHGAAKVVFGHHKWEDGWGEDIPV